MEIERAGPRPRLLDRLFLRGSDPVRRDAAAEPERPPRAPEEPAPRFEPPRTGARRISPETPSSIAF